MIVQKVCDNCRYMVPSTTSNIEGHLKQYNANCTKKEPNAEGKLFIILDKHTYTCDDFTERKNDDR